MAIDEKKTTPIPDTLKIEIPDEGVFVCYSNHIHIQWTAFDVKLQFSELADASEQVPSEFKAYLERHAAVTVSWIQAKQIAQILSTVIKNYENLNGPIPEVDQIKVP